MGVDAGDLRGTMAMLALTQDLIHYLPIVVDLVHLLLYCASRVGALVVVSGIGTPLHRLLSILAPSVTIRGERGC